MSNSSLDNSSPRILRGISTASAVLLILLATASFSISFEMLSDLASQHGIPEHLAFLFPSIIDGGMVTLSLSALRLSLRGESILYPSFLVITYTSLSVFFNITHAPTGYLSALIAATPPLVLFTSWENFMRQLKGAATHQDQGGHGHFVAPSPTNGSEDSIQANTDSGPAVIDRGPQTENANRARTDRKNQRRKTLVEAAADTPKTHKDLATEFGVSTKTIQRDFNAIDPE